MPVVAGEGDKSEYILQVESTRFSDALNVAGMRAKESGIVTRFGSTHLKFARDSTDMKTGNK